MNIIFVLALTIFIEKSCSQMLSKSQDCFSDGDILTLNCETTALNDTISFNLNAGNEGGCVPGLGCGGNITQAGTTTSLTIYPYNDAAHGGSWSCTFGLLTSPVLIIAKNPCNSTEKPFDLNMLWLLTLLLFVPIIMYIGYKLYFEKSRSNNTGRQPNDSNNTGRQPNDLKPHHVMLLLNKIDSETEFSFEWKNEDGIVPHDNFQYAYGIPPKCSLFIREVSTTDSGIYQCVRTLQNGTEDKTNVILRVSNFCEIFLIVHPLYWAKNEFANRGPYELKMLLKNINNKDRAVDMHTFVNEKVVSVEWRNNYNPVEEHKTTQKEDKQILCISSPSEAGEYTCTVKLNNKPTQLYTFLVHFLDGKGSEQDTSVNIIGVPSMLNSTG